ncbi:MAG TPA: DNA polymerase III subunit alpha, partial [Planctomycetota bacterium]
LNRFSAGITCLSGCMSGPVNRMLRREDEAAALAEAGRLQDVFGREHFYLEVMRNGMAEQDRLTEGMTRLTRLVDAPLIATNDIHYLRHEDCNAQDAMLCIHTGSKRDDPTRWRMDTDTLYFRNREEMNRIFSDLPEALRNTGLVAEQVDVQIELGKHRLPRFTPPEGRSPGDYFRELCEAGFARCYPGNPAVARERLEYEMRVIGEMGFTSYFLIVWDLIRHAHEQGIPVGPGRGSAAGSLVSYVLNITRIDPLAYDLIFERFLNPSRISMPDIDIDFCKDRREEMLRYVRERYGDDYVCQIITFGKMKAKAALRDVARVLDVPLGEVDQVAKKVPDGPGVKLAQVLADDADLAAVAERSSLHKDWLDLALKLEGLSRHSSVHAAGVVISDEPLRLVVPLSKQDDAIITQWDMNACEEIGLLKMDFLGLRTLTILADALRLIEARHGEKPDLDALPLDDAKTYELLCKADTEGIFQLESGGMRRLLADLKPSVFEDVIAVLALFRPGPLGSGLHELYARRKHGLEDVSYPHPLLEEILKETYGVLIYQEQIMRVAQRMGGFSLADADSLRKAMGKKKRALMETFEKQFVEGAVGNGVPEQTGRDIWAMMEKFAEYGFNKSHSTGYALVTYQAAWLKAHYPAEFFAATFTHEASDTDKLRVLIEDARRHGLRVLPPCVNHSTATFTVRGTDGVRYGLAAVKGVGAGAADALVRIREAREDRVFPDLDEFLVEGVAKGLNKTTFESLVKAGALDAFRTARVDLADQLEDRVRWAQRRAEDRRRGQGSLFDAMGAVKPMVAAPTADETAPAAAPADGDEEGSHHAPRRLSEDERKRTLGMEKEALGLYLTRHPLDPYRDLLAGVTPWNSTNLGDAGDERLVALAGLATLVQVRPTRKDPSRKYARLRIEDLLGSTAAIIFPKALEEFRDLVVEDFIGLFHGSLDLGGEEAVLKIDRIAALAERDKIALAGSLEIHLKGSPPVEALSAVLKAHPGRSIVRFLYTGPDGKPVALRAAPDWTVNLSGELFARLEALLGPGCARAVADRPSAEFAPARKWAGRGKTATAGA